MPSLSPHSDCPGGGVKTFYLGVNKGLFGDNVFQCGDVEPFRSLLSLGACLVLDADVELGDVEAVIGPALSATHGFGHSYILPVPLPDNDVIDEMPMLKTRVHPRRPIAGRDSVDCVGDQ